MGTGQRWTLCALCQGYVDPTIASMPFSSHLLSAAAFSSRNLSEKPARPKEIPANAPGCDRPGWRSESFCLPRRLEAVPMAKREIKHRRKPKSILKLPDLEQSKSAVLNSLTSPSSQRTYDHAIREFIEWYCSEPRLAFNKTVVMIGIRCDCEQTCYLSHGDLATRQNQLVTRGMIGGIRPQPAQQSRLRVYIAVPVQCPHRLGKRSRCRARASRCGADPPVSLQRGILIS